MLTPRRRLTASARRYQFTPSELTPSEPPLEPQAIPHMPRFPGQARVFLGDKETVMNMLSAMRDGRVGKLDTREDELRRPSSAQPRCTRPHLPCRGSFQDCMYLSVLLHAIPFGCARRQAEDRSLNAVTSATRTDEYTRNRTRVVEIWNHVSNTNEYVGV